ncbi:hypothetical protein [Brasilonema bromeliae]
MIEGVVKSFWITQSCGDPLGDLRRLSFKIGWVAAGENKLTT